MPAKDKPFKRNSTREKLHEIIFEADTPAGKFFDVALLIIIAISILVVMLESMETVESKYYQLFFWMEWGLTIFFTIEYILRLYAVHRPIKYATSFFGVIDLLAILPTYLSLLLPGSQFFLIIRALRLFRIFRIFKLGHFLKEGNTIASALRASQAKITVFLTFVMLLVIIIGAIMYLVEGGANESFSSIPKSIYWAIVTLTTVGYGDIIPITGFGQFLSAAVMLLGYSIIAVPTGIVTGEMINAERNKDNTLITNNQACRYCGREGHDNNARYCKFCGSILDEK